MRKWIKSAKNRIALALVGAQVILINYFIIPACDKLPYYKAKTHSLRQESGRLERHSFYLDRHREKLGSTRKKLETLRKRTSSMDTGAFQSLLGKLQREHGLKVVAQNINSHESLEFNDKIVVKQTLKGKYEDQMKYIQDLSSLELPIMLSECGYESADPLRADPGLSAKLEFIYLLPK